MLGAYVSQSSADNRELQPMIEAVSRNLGQKPQAVLADRGYINGAVIEHIQGQGIEAYVAVSAEAFLSCRAYDLRRSEAQRRENPRQYSAPVLAAMALKSAVRRVDAAIYAAKPVSNQSLGLLRKF